MTDQLISFKTAKLAKEKGFHEETQAMTVGENYPIVSNPQEESPYDWNSRKGYSIPTQSLLQKWLREKHSMHIDITTDYILYKSNKNLCFEVILKKNFIKCMEVGPLETYEEALEQGLFEALKLIKK